MKLLWVAAVIFLSSGALASEGHGYRAEASTRVKDGVVTLDKDSFTRADMALTQVMEEDGKIVVPASALVWSEGMPWVYMQADAYSFVRRAVAIALIRPDGMHELANLPGGVSIVTRGAQLLLSEEAGAVQAEDHD